MKLGIIGLGAIGSMHVKNIREGKVPSCEIVAVCDESYIDPQKFGEYKSYTKSDELLADKNIEAVLISTPSFTHFELGIKAMQAGKHVLIEKPVALCSADAKALEQMAKKSNKTCAVMLNQRTTPLYSRMRELVVSGELGKINRASWFMTNWYRPQIYFSCNAWRGIWKGEAGGALINQSVHNLDVFAWIFGLPQTLRAWCKFGKYHDIEVEDEVTSYMEYENGMTATFATSTGEHPGTNRFEIAGDKGFIVAQDGKLTISSFDSLSDYTMNTKYVFGTPETTVREETFEGIGEQHSGVLNNFLNAAKTGKHCDYDLSEGYASVCLSNAMLLSSWTSSEVKFPFDDDKYKNILTQKMEQSTFEKKIDKDFILDFTKSFR